MSGRLRWVALAVVVIAVAVAGAIYVGVSRPAGRHSVPISTVARAPALAPLGQSPAVPLAAAVAARLRAVAADPALGGALHADVVDAVTGRELFTRAPDVASAPASTAKLLTAAAALTVLGPHDTLSTGVVRSGDTLYLIGGGDVTLASAPGSSYPAPATIVDLADRAATALGATRSVRLCLDTTAWSGPASGPGWNAGYFTNGDIAPLSPLEVDEGEVRAGHRPRVGDPALAAAMAFRAELRRQGVTVTGAVCRSAAPASGLGLASVASAPVSALVQRMLTDSDNDLAEALGRAVARRSGNTTDFTGEARAVTSAVAALGVSTEGLHLDDASGLSRLDRVSVRTLVQLLQLASSAQHLSLRPIVVGLPVAGFTGTLADRYHRAPASAAAGMARAKTGTLAGVNAIAGFVVDADARLLVFALETDRASGPTPTEGALDRVVGALASCGCG